MVRSGSEDGEVRDTRECESYFVRPARERRTCPRMSLMWPAGAGWSIGAQGGALGRVVARCGAFFPPKFGRSYRIAHPRAPVMLLSKKKANTFQQRGASKKPFKNSARSETEDITVDHRKIFLRLFSPLGWRVEGGVTG